MRNFAAIDFETANEQPSSVCSVDMTSWLWFSASFMRNLHQIMKK